MGIKEVTREIAGSERKIVFHLKFTNTTKYKLSIAVHQPEILEPTVFSIDNLYHGELSRVEHPKEMLSSASRVMQIGVDERYLESIFSEEKLYPLVVLIRETKCQGSDRESAKSQRTTASTQSESEPFDTSFRLYIASRTIQLAT